MTTTVSMKMMKTALFLMMGLIFSLFAKGGVFADESGETGGSETLSKRLVTITEKTKTSLIADGKRYRAGDTMVVIDTSGVKLSYAALPVPCKATIFFSPVVNLDATIQQITILEVAWGARSDWTAPMPE